MRVFPLEFIDSSWFDNIKIEINEVKNKVKGVEEMYDNINKFLEKNEKELKGLATDIKSLETKLKDNENTNEKQISILTVNLDKLIVGMTKLNDELIVMRRNSEKFISEHKIEHEKHVSLLDRIFCK